MLVRVYISLMCMCMFVCVCKLREEKVRTLTVLHRNQDGTGRREPQIPGS